MQTSTLNWNKDVTSFLYIVDIGNGWSPVVAACGTVVAKSDAEAVLLAVKHFGTSALGVRQDNMGLGPVVHIPRDLWFSLNSKNK
jgi:hypothetical protein